MATFWKGGYDAELIAGETRFPNPFGFRGTASLSGPGAGLPSGS